MRSAAALFALAALALPVEASAQAWTRDAGDGYVNLSYRYLAANGFYGADGEAVPSADFNQHALGFYGEVGIIDQYLTLNVNADLVRRNELPGQGAVTGLGDTQVALWSGLLRDPFRLAVGVALGIPTGDSMPSAGEGADDVAQITARTLPTGDGETDVTLQVAAGHGFAVDGTSLEMFVQGVAGYAIRTEGFTDQFVYRAEGGLRIREEFIDRFLLIVRVTGAEILGSTAVSAGVAGVGDGISFTALGAELVFSIHEGLSLSAGVDFGVRGTNLPRAIPFKAALSYEWDA